MKSNIVKITGFILITLLSAANRNANAAELPVYIFAGQSNMVGAGELAELPVQYQKQENVLNLYDNSSWNAYEASKAKGIGPDAAAAYNLAAHFAGANPAIAIIKFAVPGTNLARQWNPNLPEGFCLKNTNPVFNGFCSGATLYPDFEGLYPKMRRAVSAGLSLLESQGVKYRLAGFIWMQGESDAMNKDAARQYHDNLAGFIGAVRRDLNSPDLPFIIGKISQSKVWIDGNIIRQAQEDIAASTNNVAIVSTDDLTLRTLPNDNMMHYNTASLVKLGERFANALIKFSPAQ